MTVVLSQRTWHGDAKYLDREGVIYHYPRQYRARISDFDKFIYYRPAHGAAEEERSAYVGHGVLGVSYEDWARANHWFVNVAWYEPFARPVPLRDVGIFVETESATSPQFQSAARPIRDTAYYRILMLGGVSSGREFAPLTTESVQSIGYAPSLALAPTDAFREALTIPEGTGYVPSGKALPSVYESAALQERARKDHNATLELVRRAAERLGGRCWYNNNIDLFVRCGEQKLLVEAKSLTDARQSVQPDALRHGAALRLSRSLQGGRRGGRTGPGIWRSARSGDGLGHLDSAGERNLVHRPHRRATHSSQPARCKANDRHGAALKRARGRQQGIAFSSASD